MDRALIQESLSPCIGDVQLGYIRSPLTVDNTCRCQISLTILIKFLSITTLYSLTHLLDIEGCIQLGGRMLAVYLRQETEQLLVWDSLIASI